MRLKKSGLLAVLLLTGASNLRAQWVPVTAKIRQTVETMEDGKVVKVERKEGNFYRNSHGSILKYWTKINGDETQGGSGSLNDNENLLLYSINVRTRQAFQMGETGLTTPLTPDAHQSASASKLGDDFVEGIRCRRVPVVIRWPDGRREPAGQNCDSIEYALTLREDGPVILLEPANSPYYEPRATQDGVTRHQVTELYDIKVGVEPDSNLFDVRKNFTVYRPEAPR